MPWILNYIKISLALVYSSKLRKNSMKNKAVSIVNISPLAREHSKSLHQYHLDRPKVGERYNADNLTVYGWILSKKALIETIDILAEDKIIQTITLDLLRPDVVAAYPELAVVQENIGFSISIDITSFTESGKTELILRANFSDGAQELLASIQASYYLAKNSGPDFIIIGAMKAATSAIYNYICQHPRVISRYPKELHYFTINFDKGLDWYLSQFAPERKNNWGQRLLTGEASPTYLDRPHAPTRLLNLFPEAKVIVSLRNPTERAISHYYHQVKRIKNEHRSLEQTFSPRELEKSEEIPLTRTYNYLNHGKYIFHLRNWLEIFPRKQILILDYHQLDHNPGVFIYKLFTFLDLEDWKPSQVEKIYGNQYGETPLLIKERLNDYFQPYNQELEELLQLKFDW